MSYIFSGLLILSQTIVFPMLSFRWAKEVTALLLVIFTILYLIWLKNKWISLFILWSLFLFILSRSYIVNDAGTSPAYNVNLISIINFTNILLFGVFYYIFHQIKIDKILIYKTLCIIGIFQSIYVILQFLQFDQFFFSISLHDGATNFAKISWPVGTMANESLVCWIIAICSPFFLAFKEMRYKVGYGVCFIACLMTKTSAGLLAFILGFLVWLWFQNRKIAITLIALCMLITGVGLGTGHFKYYLQDTHRYQVWKKSIELSKATAITGHGNGSFRELFHQMAPEFKNDGIWTQAHNEYVQILFEQGFIGIAIISCLIFTTFLKFWRKRAGLIPIISIMIFLIISIFGFPARTSMGIIPIICLVLFEKEIGV